MTEYIDRLKSGECLIYPTETLYALGAGALFPEAALKIAELKNRPKNKPLPLIIGSKKQLSMITGWYAKAFERLVAEFWPGPLSILVPASRHLPSLVKDRNGFTSVRFTNHPTAQDLCMELGMPLIATSANMAGKMPAALPGELDPAFVEEVGMVVDTEPFPGGGLPSTVVRCIDTNKVSMLREGAVSRFDLERAGFLVEAPAGIKS